MATAAGYEYRAYVGPRARQPDSAYYFDWQDLTLPSDYDSWSRNLTSSMSASAGELRINNPVGFPSPGGVFVWAQEGTTSYEADTVEYMEYSGISSNQLTGLSRPSSRRATHSPGDHVSPLYKLDRMTDGVFSVEYSVDDELLFHEWTARFSGWRCPDGVLSPGHLVLVQSRYLNTGNAWTAWSVACLGILESLKKSDDGDRNARWEGTIRPIPAVYMDTQLDAVRIGTWAIDEHCSASSSTVLPSFAAYKERGNEGYTAAAPSFDAGVLLEDSNELWISNRFFAANGSPSSNPSTNPLASNNEWEHVHAVTGFNNQQYASMLVSQININPPAGLPRGYRWIELTTYVTGVGNLRLVNKLNYSDNGVNQMITPQSLSGMEIGSHIIICENRSLFESMYPDHGAALVISAEECTGNIFDHLDKAQDGIALLTHGTGQHLSIVGWGNQDMGPTAWRYSSWQNPRVWAGPTPNAPGVGETIRYIYNPPAPTQSAHYWSTSPVETPGFDLPGYDRPNTLDQGSEDVPARWIKIELPALGLTLAEDLAPGDTSIAVQDANEAPSVSGLRLSGTVQIGEEQIAYTGKDYDGGLLTGLSVTQPHRRGDVVYQVQQGTITDGYPIDSITLTEADSGLRPQSMTFSLSQLTLGARSPDEPGYENDYFLSTTRVFGTSGRVYRILSHNHKRIRTFLLEIYSLNSEPYRPRLKRIQFQVDREQFDADYWLEEDEAGVILEEVLVGLGLPAASITYAPGLPTIDGQITSVTAARSVVTDFLRNKVCTLRIGVDSRIHIERNSFWFSTSHAEVYYYNVGTVASLQLDSDAPDEVRYVKLEYGSTDDSLSVAQYPTAANPHGAIVEVGPYDITSGQASAMVQNLYRTANWNRTATIDMAGSGTELGRIHTGQTGDVVRVQWDFHENSPDYSKRHVTVGVTRTIRAGHMFTRVTTRQIDSEDVD